MISRSPKRGTFGIDRLRERVVEKGGDPDTDEHYQGMVRFEEEWMQKKRASEGDAEWSHNNMEHDLRTTAWILHKVRTSEVYSQHLYAAMCNNDFQRIDVWPVLKGEKWSCSWRYAGGIIADMREEGDYIDWYCSGIGSGLGNGDEDGSKGYVGEGAITDEIREDLRRLGWSVVTDSDEV